MTVVSRTWVVVLEWALAAGEPLGIEEETLGEMLRVLADLEPVAMCQPDRYVVQVRLTADGPLAATGQALARHEEAVRRVPLGGELVRLELLTEEEFTDEWDRVADSEEGQAALLALGRSTEDPEAEATAAIETISGRKDAQRVLTRLVRQLGGGVVAARPEDEWTLPADISFGLGPPMVPIAEPWSIARLRLEESLPALIDQARRTLGRLAVRESGGDGGAGAPERT